MNRTITLLAGILACVFQAGAQTTWRVNNQSNYNGTSQFGENFGGTQAYPVFKQINDAVGWSNVGTNDTIHVEASPLIYAAALVTKKLTIIGPGYFHEQNENTSNTEYDAKLARIYFDPGSDGSKIMGMNVVVGNSGLDGKIYINAEAVTIKRNRILNGIVFEKTALQSVTIVENYFGYSIGNNALYTNGSGVFVPPVTIVFNNNIVRSKLIWKSTTTQWPIHQCHNNVFDGPANALDLDFATDSFKNNIVRPANVTATITPASNVQYNTVSSATLFAGTVGVQVVANMNNLFTATTATTAEADAPYQLQTGVPGNVPGADGAPRGAFGGAAPENRYTLSGLAPIPVIYDVATSGVSSAGTGLPVTIKARTVK